MSYNETVVSSGQVLVIEKDEIFSKVTIESGGMVEIKAGGSAEYVVQSSGGALLLDTIQSAHAVYGENELGAFCFSGGFASNYVFNSYQKYWSSNYYGFDQSCDMTFIDPLINNNAEVIFDGGDYSKFVLVSDATVSSGGYLGLNAGPVENNYLEDYTTLVEQSDRYSISNVSAIVKSGGALGAYGNYNDAIIVESGGEAQFSSRAIVNNLNAESGSFISFQNAATLMGSDTNIASGSIYRFIHINVDGYEDYKVSYASACVINGVAQNFVLDSHFNQIGVASGLIMSGAQINYYDASLIVYSGGIANGTIIASSYDAHFIQDFNMVVFSGGVATNTTAEEKATVLNIGTLENITVASNGKIVNSGTLDGAILSSKSTLKTAIESINRNITLESGAAITANLKNYYTGDTIISGASETYIEELIIVSSGVFSLGGALNNLHISKYETTWMIASGAHASGLQYCCNDSLITVKSGAIIENTILEGSGSYWPYGDAAMVVEAGAVSLGTSLYEESMLVFGEASGTSIDHGGTLALIAGGVARDTTILSGILRIFDASAYNTTGYGVGQLLCSGTCILGGTTSVERNLYIYDDARVQNEGTIVFSLGDQTRVVTSAMIHNFSMLSGGDYEIKCTDDLSSNIYILADNVTTVPDLTITIGGETKSIKVGGSFAYGDYQVELEYSDEQLTLNVSLAADNLSGSGDTNGNYTLTENNVTLYSLSVGTANSTDGNVTTHLGLTGFSTGNIYGGGVNVSIGGDVYIRIANAGTALGLIYGGSLAYGKDISIDGDIFLTVNDITQQNNTKLLDEGCTAWVIGGGGAVYGGYLTTGATDINMTYSNLNMVVGGAQADGAGSTATVASTNIYCFGVTITGNIYGGGYAYDGGTSIVRGDTDIYICGGTSIAGNIYGGGANPYHAVGSGTSIVNGGSTITFSGLCELDFSGIVSGDGVVVGTVNGTKTLNFEDFQRDFNGKIVNFDRLEISGNSQVAFTKITEADGLYLDLATSPSSLVNCGSFCVDFEGGFSFSDEDTGLVEVNLGTLTAGNYDLIDAADLSVFDDASFRMVSSNSELAVMAIGDTLDYNGGTLSLEEDNGIKLVYTLS